VLQVASAAATVVPPLDVQKKVRPILDLCRQAASTQGKGQDAAFFEAARLVGKLSKEKTKSSDEALVVLMSFYIGESTGEDLLRSITIRGRRMLPLLLRYRDARVFLPEKDYASIRLPAEVRKDNFDNAIKSINARRRISED